MGGRVAGGRAASQVSGPFRSGSGQDEHNERGKEMATTKQTQAARTNVKKAQQPAKSKKTIAHVPKQARRALGKQASAVAQRKRTGASSPKTRAELYEIARQRDLPGRSKMGRDELARKLGLS